MKILITGATGYIGSATVSKLLAAGHRVTAIVRSESSALKAQTAGAIPVIGDLYSSPWLTEELKNHEAAIHTAAPTDGTAADLNAAVIDAAIAAFEGTDKSFILTGGIWSYGANARISEESPVDAADISAWRGPLEQRLLDSNVKATVIEPGVVYGKGAGLPRLLVDAPRTGEGALTLIGSGEQRWTSVHVDDLADLYVAALTNAKGGQRYVGASGDNPTVREIGEAAAGPDGVSPEPVASTRERLGAGLANALLLDQAARTTKARDAFDWKPAQPSLLEELANGYGS